MKFNLGAFFGGADSDAVGRPSRRLRILFSCWVGLDAVVVIGLAGWNLKLTSSAWDLLGSALLLGIGVTCALALMQILAGSKNALLTSMVSQILVAGLAVYVWIVDLRSPVSQLFGITGIALAIGAIALVWALYLARYARGAMTKTAAVVVALFPLAGFVQFWLQTDYLPEASRPLIDTEAELSPVGATGPIIHLQAKVTMRNRGSVEADLHVALMRVTSYPVGTVTQPATAETLAAALNPMGSEITGPYRETPDMPRDAHVLLAEMVASPYEDAFISPGGSVEFKRDIDVDSRTVRLVHLSFAADAVTHRLIQDTYTCYPPRVSYSQDPLRFLAEAATVHDWGAVGSRVLCTETEFASEGAIHDLVSDHPVLKTLVVVDNPRHDLEVPLFISNFGTRESVDDLSDVRTETVVEKSIPAASEGASAEYEPSDADLRRGPG